MKNSRNARQQRTADCIGLVTIFIIGLTAVALQVRSLL